MFNKTSLKSFHQTWHVKKKSLQNLKGAPVVYLILLCGPIRRTGAERTTIWRKWRIHYLAKGVNSWAEMDPPWGFFFFSSSFGAVNIKQWRLQDMRGRELKGKVTLGHLARCYLLHKTGWTRVLFDPLPYTQHLALWAVRGDKHDNILLHSVNRHHHHHQQVFSVARNHFVPIFLCNPMPDAFVPFHVLNVGERRIELELECHASVVQL